MEKENKMFLQRQLERNLVFWILFYTFGLFAVGITTFAVYLLAAAPMQNIFALLFWLVLELAIYTGLLTTRVKEFRRELSTVNAHSLERFTKRMHQACKEIKRKTKGNNVATDQYRALLYICFNALNEGIKLRIINSLLGVLEENVYILEYGFVEKTDDYALILRDNADEQLAVIRL